MKEYIVSVFPELIKIKDKDCVNNSFPHFWDELEKL